MKFDTTKEYVFNAEKYWDDLLNQIPDIVQDTGSALNAVALIRKMFNPFEERWVETVDGREVIVEDEDKGYVVHSWIGNNGYPREDRYFVNPSWCQERGDQHV